MPRPKKLRKISFMPEDRYFVPDKAEKEDIEDIVLKFEELEAMRLKDIEKLSQEECAEMMHVSRQTFQLIIDKARNKVAMALTQGKAIRIHGGNYTFNICKYTCKKCGKDFEEAYESQENECPKCGSDTIKCRVKKRCCMKNKNVQCNGE
ncbi:DUF134 domain-containing protein [Anaeromicrobium sediminis]|uniref:UPF0251 protein CCE28_10380 n=1 Tax=Anaeromicrobium sediminis TaxID=1478221 RepID=A0A267MI55_9FIRM|nr:DUF134 domain-containing protein [Anaeromicrobium sediminis]PAB59264.1 hypothetical protein CCE28_10380 [Anaeromicrobium sediminis]